MKRNIITSCPSTITPVHPKQIMIWGVWGRRLEGLLIKNLLTTFRESELGDPKFFVWIADPI
ncbi:CLUMA_CG004296, isoform A [Clunio marinus]|uniref:CLUMA_CG004296, isoform A n=1 Tax=Clunio marinus TaxID=568069 RepID=A0A1J1HSS4_9DIPT|nr:CLUMA_CG004296, isoform A [Clunio marinus]